MGKDLNDLSDLMNDFVSAKGWYNKDTKRPQTPRNIAISLVLEASEILEQFQWNDQVTDKESLSLELADVSLYLLQLARICEIDLEKAINQKLELNYNREWDQNTVK
ncbi:MAG: MazG-like family protein [Anaerolineaceae bacterium]|nr:MAG: nucleotide pyrophosphohydrolase [Chloroflexi bacterium HGW-Chloroflexi-8]